MIETIYDWSRSLREKLGIPLTYALVSTFFSFIAQIPVLLTIVIQGYLIYFGISLPIGTPNLIFVIAFITLFGYLVSAWFAGIRKLSHVIELFLLQGIISFLLGIISFFVSVKEIKGITEGIIPNLFTSFISAYASVWLFLKYKISHQKSTLNIKT